MKAPEGTLTVFVGPPGCGKSYAASWYALRVARDNDLPLIAIDPSGDVTKYAQGFRDYAYGNGDDDTYRWLNDRDNVRIMRIGSERGQYSLERAVDAIGRVIVDANNDKVEEPQCIIYYDELAALREGLERAQNVTIPLQRNAGAYGVGTCQTMVGMTPRARTCLRHVVPYQTPAGSIELSGRRLDNSELNVPCSDVLWFVSPMSLERVRVVLGEAPPFSVAAPVVPTRIVKRPL